MKNYKSKFRLPYVFAKINTLQQYIIWKFCENAKDTNWPREIKISNQLVKQYSSAQFWKFISVDFKMDSLCYFLGEKGKNQLKFLYLKFKYRKPEEEKSKISEEKSGEDFPLQKKDKKFFNFKSYH